MSEYLGEEAVRAHEARIEALSQMFEDVELQGKEMSAMQEFDSRIFTHRFYHEAPNDVFELIFLHFSDLYEYEWGKGGLNVMRLVSKRCMQVVESVATRLTGDGAVTTLPISALKRCTRIEHIGCYGLNSFEGCPDGLKSLYIEDGESLESMEHLSACKELETVTIRRVELMSDLSPLSSCTRLKKLILANSKVTDLTPLSLMLLEELDLWNASVKEISPLSVCKRLKILNVGHNQSITDLSPLCHCSDLEELDISELPLIRDLSFIKKGFTKLRVLNINQMQVDELSPLTKLQSMEELICYGIPPTTSIISLSRCYTLKKLNCLRYVLDLGALREKRADLVIRY